MRLFIQGLTYEQIGRTYDITRQRVQQIIKPPQVIYESVKARACGRCERCSSPALTGHVHHIAVEGRTLANINAPDNLLYVCKSCHAIVHKEELAHSRQLRRPFACAATG